MKSGNSARNPATDSSMSVNSSVNTATTPAAITTSNDTFIVVKYGDNIDKIFNSNCKVQLLLENIRQRCKIKEKVIDLSDTNGNLINLRDDAFKTRYAHFFLKPRQTLVLIEVRITREPHSLTYVPLLDNKDIITESFMLKLQPKVAQQPQVKRGSNAKSSASQIRNNGGRNSVISVHQTSAASGSENAPKSRSNSLLKEKDESSPPVVSVSRKKSIVANSTSDTVNNKKKN